MKCATVWVDETMRRSSSVKLLFTSFSQENTNTNKEIPRVTRFTLSTSPPLVGFVMSSRPRHDQARLGCSRTPGATGQRCATQPLCQHARLMAFLTAFVAFKTEITSFLGNSQGERCHISRWEDANDLCFLVSFSTGGVMWLCFQTVFISYTWHAIWAKEWNNAISVWWSFSTWPIWSANQNEK